NPAAAARSATPEPAKNSTRKTASPVVAAVAPPRVSALTADPAPAAAPEAPAVVFADATLEACVRAALGRPAGSLHAGEVAGLTELHCSTPDASHPKVTRLEGIQSLVGLVTLDLSSNQITDIRPLARLNNLKALNLRSNQIADIGPVATLPGACEIDLWQNPIADITPLLLRGKR
ncbi:MAG: leucine-rich repeat domain-containing protein, partial [Deferrisomatales bacterium]|nr:leucine-rich repeat domain-containing protein [Deferrisomatales bacterium]